MADMRAIIAGEERCDESSIGDMSFGHGGEPRARSIASGSHGRRQKRRDLRNSTARFNCRG